MQEDSIVEPFVSLNNDTSITYSHTDSCEINTLIGRFNGMIYFHQFNQIFTDKGSTYRHQ